MNIDEYIVTSEDIEEQVTQAEQAATVPKPKRKKQKQKDDILVEDHELTRKRDILAFVALLDGLKNYIGENITAAQIRNMEKEKLETYFTLYMVKSGQEVTNDMMLSLVEMSVKGLSYVVDIDNEEDLKNDLLNNKQLRRTIGKQAAEIVEKYGDAVAVLRVAFDVFKHISFSPKDVLALTSTNQVPASTNAALDSTC